MPGALGSQGEGGPTLAHPPPCPALSQCSSFQSRNERSCLPAAESPQAGSGHGVPAAHGRGDLGKPSPGGFPGSAPMGQGGRSRSDS